jgi:AcrR family transcriptional regulator
MANRSSARSGRPQAPGGAGDQLHERPLVQAAISRSLGRRYDAAADEVSRLVESAYRVIERSGTVDPRMREILADAGLSTQAFYRHFPSKDDLLLVLLDDGARRLTDYLTHQMAKATTARGRVRAWIEGVLAQAIDAEAAARTRPFLANLARLAERYPDAQQAQVSTVVAPLVAAVRDAVKAGDARSADPAADARAIYHLAMGDMEAHVLARTSPTKREVNQVVSFALRAIGAG